MLGAKVKAALGVNRNNTDERRTSRPRIRRAGTIKLLERTYEEPCLVVDISGDGARIQTVSPVGLVHHLRLTVPSLHLDVTCEVIWVGESEIGVRFLKRHEPTTDPRWH